MKSLRLILVLAVLLAASPLLAADATVRIRRGGFAPAAARVAPGDSVTWVNADDRDHSIDGGDFRSGTLKPGASFTHRFARPGRYAISCPLHPRESMAVIVE